MTDPELIVRVLLHEDRAAFGQLVQRHQSAVRQFLRHLNRGDTAMADDLAQETFITAWDNLTRFHGGSTFLTWLLGIAHNHARNARRQQYVHSPPNPEATEQTAPPATLNSDLRQDLAAAVRALSEDEQIALHLHYQQGQSHSEIATLLSCPLGTVKTHLARAKEKLRHHLAAWNPQK